MPVLSKGALFNEELVSDLVNKVQGRSSLAVLSHQTPIPFVGEKIFTFTMDSDIDIVAENGKKSEGGVTVEPVKMTPIKVEYGARVSDEFMYAAEETQLDMLRAFNEGFAKKLARGLDLMAIHGINPRSKTESTVIGDNCFIKKVTQNVVFTEAEPDLNAEAAIALVQGSEGIVTGMALDASFASALAKLKVSGVKAYPELAWGANPGKINGLAADVNATVGAANKLKSLVGDFENMFQWGYAKEVPLKVIEYGDPDGTGKDLQNYNQVYLRAEAYLGWGIFDAKSFATIKAE